MHLKKTVNLVSCFAVLLLLLAMLFFPQSNKYDWIGPLMPFYIALGLVAVVYVGGMTMGNKQIKAPGLLLLFVGWTILSFAFSDIRSFGFAEVLVTIASAVLFLYVSGEDVREVFRKYIPHIVIFILLVSAVGGIWTYLSTDHTRFFGLFYNPLIKADAWPNAYAAFFLLVFPFYFTVADSSCDLMSDASDKKCKCFLISLLSGFALSSFFLTYSRAGFIAFAIELLILFVFFRPKSNKCILNTFIVIVVVATCSTYLISNLKAQNRDMESLKGRITFNDSVGASSFNERFEFFSGSAGLITNEPLFGYGPMSFKWAYPQVQEGFLAISDHPHNIFLKYGVERGIPAAAFFLGLILIAFWGNNPLKPGASSYDKIAWIALLGFLAHSMVDYNSNFIINEFLFWIILASVFKGKKARFAGGGMALTAVLLTLMVFLYRQTQDFKPVLIHPTKESIEESSILLPRFSYYEIYEKVSDDEALSEAALLKQLSINNFDTLTMWRLAQLYEKQGKTVEAEELYNRAIVINPKNTFLIYLDYIKLEMKLDKESNIMHLKQEVLPLIVEYEKLYEMNLHYTQSSNEKVYVDELKSLPGI